MKEITEQDIIQKIHREIEKTKATVIEYQELSKPVAPDVAIGRISRMDAINNKSISEASLREAKKKLQDLERVLSFQGTEDFGRCLKCRKTIPLGRMWVRPESLYCIACAR